jgi:hypothetical protein
MRRRAAHYSRALQIGLGVSFALAVALAGIGVLRAQDDTQTTTLAIQDLRSRAAELVDLIDARQAGRLTDPYTSAQATQWTRVVHGVHRELAKAVRDDRSGDAARAEEEARALLALADALRAPQAPDAATRAAAQEVAARVAALDRARPR